MTLDESLKIVNSLSVATGMAVALLTLRKWRADLFAKRRIDLCEDVLTRLYEIRDAIRRIRNPLVLGGEGSSRPQIVGETDEKRNIEQQAYVYAERFESEKEPFEALDKMKYRFMAIYGEEWQESFQKFVTIIRKIIIAARSTSIYYQDRQDIHPDRLEKKARQQEERYAILFWTGDESDPLDKEVEKAISDLAAKCKTEIMRESSIFHGIHKFRRLRKKPPF